MRRCVTLIWAGTDSSALYTSPDARASGLFLSLRCTPTRVGAGLPAIAVHHSAKVLSVTPSSLASQLPQVPWCTLMKLWKTNSATCQSATYRRCKWLFFHSFDLSPFAVELAVNNVGVAGRSPLKPWLAEVWLFFDQAFSLGRQTSLSTFL